MFAKKLGVILVTVFSWSTCILWYSCCVYVFGVWYVTDITLYCIRESLLLRLLKLWLFVTLRDWKFCYMLSCVQSLCLLAHHMSEHCAIWSCNCCSLPHANHHETSVKLPTENTMAIICLTKMLGLMSLSVGCRFTLFSCLAPCVIPAWYEGEVSIFADSATGCWLPPVPLEKNCFYYYYYN